MFSKKEEGGMVDGQAYTAPAEEYPLDPACEGNFKDLHGTLPLHEP